MTPWKLYEGKEDGVWKGEMVMERVQDAVSRWIWLWMCNSVGRGYAHAQKISTSLQTHSPLSSSVSDTPKVESRIYYFNSMSGQVHISWREGVCSQPASHRKKVCRKDRKEKKKIQHCKLGCRPCCKVWEKHLTRV